MAYCINVFTECLIYNICKGIFHFYWQLCPRNQELSLLSMNNILWNKPKISLCSLILIYLVNRQASWHFFPPHLFILVCSFISHVRVKCPTWGLFQTTSIISPPVIRQVLICTPITVQYHPSKIQIELMSYTLKFFWLRCFIIMPSKSAFL